jgi:hypothetical protein
MSEPDYKLRQGDTSPWELTLKDNGGAVDLTNADSVALFMRRKRASVNKIDGAAVTVVTPATGSVRFEPSTSDVDESGLFDSYYLVTWVDDTENRFPTDGSGHEYYDVIEITPNLE